MTKTNDTLLGLAPVPRPPTGLSLAGGRELFQPNRAPTKTEKRILGEFDKAMLIIDATHIKAEFGMTALAELHQHTATTFFEGARSILGLKDQAQGGEVQVAMNEWTGHQLRLFAKH